MATLDDDDKDYLFALLEPFRQASDRHERALFGNGQPGLIKDVEGLKATKATRTKREWLSVGGITTVISAIVAGVIAGITHTPPTQ